MAGNDVILTQGGLVSQAPEAGRATAISKITGEKVSEVLEREGTLPSYTGSTSGASKVAEFLANERARQIEAERQAEEKRIAAEKLEATRKAAQEQALIAETRAKGVARLEIEAREKAQSEQLIKALEVQEQLKLEAERRGKAFTIREAEQFRKARGVSRQDVQRATLAARAKFRETGVSVQEQVRQNVMVEQLPVATPLRFQPTMEEFKQTFQPDSQRFRIGLSEAERRMPTKEVIKGRFKEVGIGLAQTGITTAETAINLFAGLGVQKITPGEERKKFQFGGKLGEIRDAPLTTGTILGQALVFAPLTGAAAVSVGPAVSALGVTGAIRAGAGAFAPFAIRAGAFGALEGKAIAEQLRFDVASIRQTTQEGITTRAIIGRTRAGDRPAEIISRQVSRRIGDKEVGKAVSTIVAPRTTILPTGEVITGVRSARTEAFFIGEQATPKLKPVSPLDLLGVTGRVATRTTAEIITTPTEVTAILTPRAELDIKRIGAISRRVDEFDVFAAGPGKRVLRVGSEPGQRLRLERISVRGIEKEFKRTGITFEKITEPTEPTKGVLKQIQETTVGPVITTPTVTKVKTPEVKPIVKTTIGLKAPEVKTEIIQPQILETKQFIKLDTISRQRVTPIVKLEAVTDVVTRTRQITKPLTKLETVKETKKRVAQVIKPKVELKQQLERTGFVPIPTFPKTSEVPKETVIPRLRFQLKKPTPTRDRFGVEVRRGGVFRTIATTGDLRKAFSIGAERVGTTLAATFRIKGDGRTLSSLPGFRTKVTKEGVEFIEKRGRRLSKRGERVEIQIAKKKKKRNNKR